MAASISSYPVPGGTWLIAQGERGEVFAALGEHARESIRQRIASAPYMVELRERLTASSALNRRFDTVVSRSRAAYPQAWREVVKLAEGAGVALDDLLLLNLRGDLGADDGVGCSDLAWAGAGESLLAHNEDGDITDAAGCSLLTLLLDGEPAVTTWWYHGFLPSNAFAFNEYGVCWGIDNVNVSHPAGAPGRHFVARAVQTARSVESFIETLETSPSAGGFAYTVGSMRSGRSAVVETAAGSTVVHRLGATACVWHTNHLRMLACPGQISEDSRARANVFSDLAMPAAPDRDFLFQLFTEDPVIGGQRPALATLATVLYDLKRRQALMKIGDASPIAISADHVISWTLAAEMPRFRLWQPRVASGAQPGGLDVDLE